jgi:hypothetical protein
MLSRSLQLLGFICFVCTLAHPGQAGQPVVIFEKDGWNAQMSGFVELDAIFDSTRSVAEASGNAPVDLPTSSNGSHARSQFSLRNTRLGFSVQAPEVCAFTSKGVLEFDLLGYNPSPGATNSEAALFNSPTLRLRHAYLQANSAGFQLLVGQYWQLFGWQPNYFMSTEQVAPIASMLYNRTAQIRVMHTTQLGGDFATLQLALAALRPPQRDGVSPDFQGGVRLAFNQRTSAFTGGSSNPVKQQPGSIGLSSLVRNFAIPGATASAASDNFAGWAVAANVFVPVLSDLALLSEFTYGTGYGDQFVGWSGNLSNPVTSASKTVNLDGGIGGFDANGNFALINLYTFNVHAQYHLPSWLRTYINLGMGQLYSDNMANLTPAAGKVAYNRSMVIFANVVHSFSDQIRAGFEYAYTQTGYFDNTLGYNNRYQLTTHFIF